METTVAIEQFPLAYFPVRNPFYGIQTTVSGAGFNLALVLKKLDNEVDFATLIGPGDNGMLAQKAIKCEKLDDDLVRVMADATAQSVILYAPNGKRQILVDLKNFQECDYPQPQANTALESCDAVILCNM